MRHQHQTSARIGRRHGAGVKGLYRSAVVLLLLLLIGTACGSATDVTQVGDPASSADGDFQATPLVIGEPEADQGPALGPLRSSGNADYSIADKITQLPPAMTGLPVLASNGPLPIGLTIGALEVSTAEVLAVGAEDNGDMEIPPADKVGWYQFGASPGDPVGSAVLAAHIAYDGENGVFVDLDDLELGSLIQVEYDDGSIVEFIATEKEQYDKDQLPRASIFDRSGEPQLVLITCGGDFNRDVRSYEDNVVVYATPVDGP